MSESSARPRAVVDTNLFVSGAISPFELPRQLLCAWTAQRFELLLSARQHAELSDVFARPRLAASFQLPPEQLASLFVALNASARVPLRPMNPLPVRDVKDEHVLAAAFGGDADYLITGDNDLLVLAGDPPLGKLKIVTAAEFLAILDRLAADETIG
jgi:putative PIN family toxin of toxin-antitoxin system